MKTTLMSTLSIIFLGFTNAQGTWTQKTSLPSSPRIEAGSFEINGKGYLVCGRDPATQTYYNDLWEYDPGTDSWTQKASFPGPARREPVAYTLNGKGYVGTGRDLSVGFSDWWEYNPANDTWTQKANFPGIGRRDALGFAIGTKGYLGSGQTVSGFTLVAQVDWWEYNPVNNTWTQKANIPGPARSAGQAIATGTVGYVGMGRVTSGNTNDWWEYNPTADVWTQKANFGPGNRDETSAFVIGSTVYVGTGHAGANMSDWWAYDGATDSWTQVTSMTAGRTEGTSFILNNKGYIATGYTTVLDAELWEFTPPVATPAMNASTIANAFATVLGTPSASQSCSVSGSNLSANMVLTAPANFEISLSSGSGFGGSLTLTPVSGSVPATTIYVRYNPGATGSHSGNITVTSTGATTKNIAVSGTCSSAGSPNISATSTFGPFSTTVGTPSATQTLTVSGTNLTANLIISAPINFEVSLSAGSGFAGSVSLTPVSGTVSSTTIYVRYNPASSGNHNGNLVLSSTGATSQNILLSGSSTNLGINEVTESYSVVTYPNPMSTYTTIEIRSNLALSKEDLRLSLTDMNGKSVLSDLNWSSAEKNGVVGITIERGNIKNGMYFFEITNKDQPVTKGKIMME